MPNSALAASMSSVQRYFEKTLECFTPQDGEFAPHAGMFTVAQHVAHAAQTVEWFFEGAFRPEGVETDFAALEKDVRAIQDLEDATAWWKSACQEAQDAIANSAEEAWNEPIRGQIMAGMPRHTILQGITDHTAHHRGALAVYARLLGHEPAMPYG